MALIVALLWGAFAPALVAFLVAPPQRRGDSMTRSGMTAAILPLAIFLPWVYEQGSEDGSWLLFPLMVVWFAVLAGSGAVGVWGLASVVRVLGEQAPERPT